MPSDCPQRIHTPFVPERFDDPETRLRYRLGQDAVPTLEGGRHLLYNCPVCKRTWYQAGRREYCRLTAEQLAHLGATFHANVQALHTLPRALCPICSTVFLDGMFTIEEYTPHKGYHFTWQSALPPYAILLAMIRLREKHTVAELVQDVPDTLVSPIHHVHSALRWLETCSTPQNVWPLTDEEGHLLAQRFPPYAVIERKSSLWRGYAWHDVCLPLIGVVTVVLAAAIPPCESAPFTRLCTAWSMVARVMRTVW
jgi:hypothetical protein